MADPRDALTVAAAESFTWKDWFAAAALVAAVFLMYQPCWHGGFLFDDELHLLNNPVLKPGGLAKIWVPGSYLNYWPLTFTAYWLQFQLWGLQPLGFHLVNLAFHALSALLVWRVLERLEVPGALFAAAIFALHPVNVETAAWIAHLKDILALTLALVSMLFYLDSERYGSRWRYGLAIAAFLLSALAKGTAVTLPIALLACAWWQRGRIGGRDLLRVLPYFLIGAVMAEVELWSQHSVALGEVVRTDDFFSRLAVAGCAIWFYLGKVILPFNLCPIYPRWSIDERSVLSYLPGVIWLIVLGVAWWKRRTWGRTVVMLMVCYAALLLPILGFANIYFMRFSLVSDHWQYIATIVPCAVFSGVTTTLARRLLARPVAITGVAALLVVLGVLSSLQSRIYAGSERFYQSVLARNPDCWLAYYNLGNFRESQGQVASAIADYQKALAIKPDYAEADNNLGSVLLASGQADAAILHFQRALEIKPDYVDAHNNLAMELLSRGQFDSAVAHLQRALEIDPDYPKAHNNLGNALLSHGQADLAIAQYRKALAIEPDFVDARKSLASALASHGKIEEAMAQYEELLVSDPKDAAAHFTLANLLAGRGQVDAAILHFQKAVEIKPDLVEAQYDLGNSLLSRGEVDAAIIHFQKAVEIKPDYAEAHYNLGTALLGRGQVDSAITHFQKAAALKPDWADAQANLATALASRGELDQAIDHYQESLEINSENSVARQNLALVRSQRELILKALAEKRAAIRSHPSDLALLNDTAWMLATNPNASVRNGAEAIELAERASKLSRGTNPAVLQTLAAAYAEAGRFAEAVRTEEQAGRLASVAVDQTRVAQSDARLKLYKSGTAYRETPKK